jgi:hypothetical protein
MIIDAPELIYYHSGEPDDIRPASRERPWFDLHYNHHAYKCLPITIAAEHGWMIHSPEDFSVTWNGGPDNADVTVRGEGPWVSQANGVVPHFSRGSVTINLRGHFAVSEGWNIVMSPPLNYFKDGIQGMTAVVELDWLNYRPTMNYVLTRPGTVEFKAGDPLCQIWPEPRGYLVNIRPKMMRKPADLQEDENAFAAERGAAAGATTKRYMRGVKMSGEKGTTTHETKLRLAPFERID